MSAYRAAVGGVSALFLPLVMACTGGGETSAPNGSISSSSSSSSSSGQTTATAQAIVTSRFEAGTGLDCREVGPLLDIGSFGDPAAGLPSQAVKNGEAWKDAPLVDVGCASKGTGDTFNVTASIAGGGVVLNMRGSMRATGPSTLRVDLSRGDVQWADDGCVAQFTEPNMGVANGRVWAELSCPRVVRGDDATQACGLRAEIRFENCAQ